MDRAEYRTNVCQINSYRDSMTMSYATQRHRSVYWKNVRIYVCVIAHRPITSYVPAPVSIFNRAAGSPRTAAVLNTKSLRAIWRVSNRHRKVLAFWCWCRIVYISPKFVWRVSIKRIAIHCFSYTLHLVSHRTNSIYCFSWHSESSGTWVSKPSLRVWAASSKEIKATRFGYKRGGFTSGSGVQTLWLIWFHFGRSLPPIGLTARTSASMNFHLFVGQRISIRVSAVALSVASHDAHIQNY